MFYKLTIIALALTAASCSPCWDQSTADDGTPCGNQCCTASQSCNNGTCQALPCLTCSETTTSTQTSTSTDPGNSACRASAVTGSCAVLETQCGNSIAGACNCAAACIDAMCGDANPGAEQVAGNESRSEGFGCPY